MSKTACADALIAELRKLPAGVPGDRAALRAAIGCTAAELRTAIDRLRWRGLILFGSIELAGSMRAPADDETTATDRPAVAPAGGPQTTVSKEGPTADPPGGAEAQPGRPTGRQEPIVADGAKRTLPPHIPAPKPPSLAEAVAHEAEIAVARRRQARSTGSVCSPLSAASRPLVEAVQLEAVATPHDLIAAIGRKHPALIARAVKLGRARGTTPAAAIYSALEVGLSHVERESTHGSA